MNATHPSRGVEGNQVKGWVARGEASLRRSPAGATFNGKSKETSVCMEHMSWLRAVGVAALPEAGAYCRRG